MALSAGFLFIVLLEKGDIESGSSHLFGATIYFLVLSSTG